MKKIRMFLIVSSLFTLILSACGGGTSSTTITFPEPKADRVIQTPFVEWPRVLKIDPATGKTVEYQVVTLPDTNEQGTQPQIFPNSELIPYTPSSDQVSLDQQALAELGISPDEQVYVLMLPSSWQDEDTGEEISLPALATMTTPTRNMCLALAGHIIYRVTMDGMTYAVLLGGLEAYQAGQIVPNVVKTGANGASAVQFVYQGVKFLILFGNESVPPTIVAPVMGNTLGRLAGSLNSLVVGKGKSVGIVQDSIALVKCLIDNWPKTRAELDEMVNQHNRTYSAKHLDTVPESFPVPFPKKEDGAEKAEMVLVTVNSGDFSRVNKAGLNFLIASGVVVAWITPFPGDEVAATSFVLKLAFAP